MFAKLYKLLTESKIDLIVFKLLIKQYIKVFNSYVNHNNFVFFSFSFLDVRKVLYIPREFVQHGQQQHQQSQRRSTDSGKHPETVFGFSRKKRKDGQSTKSRHFARSLSSVAAKSRVRHCDVEATVSGGSKKRRQRRRRASSHRERVETRFGESVRNPKNWDSCSVKPERLILAV